MQVSPPKHLVLEDDVHRALRLKKDECGLTVRDIGNCLLRSTLGQRSVADVICSELVASGALTKEQLVALHDRALEELRAAVPPVSSLVRVAGGTCTAGSWTLRELHRAPDDSYQVVLARARDARKHPFPAHIHEGDTFFVVLSGSLLVTADHRSEVLTAPRCIDVPRHAVHSITPGTKETVVLIVLSPSEPAYAL